MELCEAHWRGQNAAAQGRTVKGQDRGAVGQHQERAPTCPVILPSTNCRLYYRLVSNDAQGFFIITATNSTKPARETELAPGGAVMGRFTAALVNGIETGAADSEYRGEVRFSDLRRYLGHAVTGQTPQFYDIRASGDPLISFSPATAAALLDPEVLADLDAAQWHRRRGDRKSTRLNSSH